MKVTIRKFALEDIPNKIRWINDPENNQYLHYRLPLEYEKTVEWFQKNQGRTDRYDAVIEADGLPVGLIGLLSIDGQNRKAEYYVSMGDTAYKGKGAAYQASRLILEYGFVELGLQKIYLYTETGNTAAQKLFRRVGFRMEGILKKDLFSRGRYVDRYVYGIMREDYFRSVDVTPIQSLGEFEGCRLYVKRDDMIPYSFGGNKARKGFLFFDEIEKGEYDCVVTYGSSHSNHCRIIANMAAARELPCHIVSPAENADRTFNSRLMELFGAGIITVPVEKVHDTIEAKLEELRSQGRKPYFIPGGGHGNLGTRAYVQCYEEICHYESEKQLHFDYVFLASGTGTTQAGLVCGQIMNGDDRKIVGVSIARKNPRGRDVVVESVRDYLQDRGVAVSEEIIQEKTIFIDRYTGEGYGKKNVETEELIRETMLRYGMPLDSTYTGKAFLGMKKYVEEEHIDGKNILFLHTGGSPLFFDDIGSI